MLSVAVIILPRLPNTGKGCFYLAIATKIF